MTGGVLTAIILPLPQEAPFCPTSEGDKEIETIKEIKIEKDERDKERERR